MRFFFFGLFLMSSSVFAQSPTEQVSSKSILTNNETTRGFRMSVVKPLDYKVLSNYSVEKSTGIFTSNGPATSNSDSYKNVLGISLGYVSLPVEETGWTTGLTYLHSAEAGKIFDLYRLDGNLAFAFTSRFYAKAGVNVSSTSDYESKSSELNVEQSSTAGLGFQIGGGFQLNKNIGIELSYVEMNQNNSLKAHVVRGGQDVTNMVLVGNSKITGTEIALTGTF